ncbi:hypothetical protein sscle_10g076180 [Sclerotinia sclerotiorum 1980 UF-70]|uniref:DUF4470 domain-containing protein n=1 Tax=Sclerotinia sclerotiorum (strain ATCC 18683 / 1980 / Ss-1) TaxID=665079 RepID=A0A1D9QD62_SCLS1|nr:hypothetical protein sscle_10g076180 [Sclerotinia sclerotiorum 1980 UF-70]
MAADDNAVPCTLKPRRNLTATYFELGRYTLCRDMTKQVIEIIKETMPEDKVILAKLAQREQRSTEHIPQVSEQEKLKRRLKIYAPLPRYHASLYTTTDYFTVGHDVAESLFNVLLQDFPRKNNKTMLFFLGGIGDSRNLYATMIDLHTSEKKGVASRRNYHFVANGHNKCALTRNLIIWKLLDELSTLAHDSDQGLMALATIFFIYESYLMPKYIHGNLRRIMENILVSLEKGDSPLPWVSLHAHDIPKYIEVLKSWISENFQNFTALEVMHGIRIALSQRAPFHDRNCKEKQFDYIGGHLSTFLYITPIMKLAPSSILQSNCLRNAGSWDSIESFLADYQCITDKEMLRQLTGVSVINEPLKDTIFPLIGYNWYTPALPIFHDDWSVMLPRNDFQKWFYALFFRLALPYKNITESRFSTKATAQDQRLVQNSVLPRNGDPHAIIHASSFYSDIIVYSSPKRYLQVYIFTTQLRELPRMAK